MSELGRLIKLEYGVALLAEFRTGHGFPVFGSNGEVGRHSKCLVEGPGIIVGRKGSVGKVSWSSESFWPIDTTYFVSATKEKLKWIYWILCWLPLERLDTSTGVPGLNRNDVYNLSVFEPCDDEKRMVAQILDTLDTTIRQTEAIIAKLQQVKQGLLHDLLTRGIDANGQLRPPVEQAPRLYKESPLGWIPREWEVEKLSKACFLIRDGTHLPPARISEGPLLLSVRNMKDGNFVLTEQDTHISESFYNQMHKHWVIEKGDVLLAIVGATIGKIAMVCDMPKFTLQRSVAILRGKQEVLVNQFLFSYFGYPEFQISLWRQVNQTAQPGIYLDQLGSICIRLPSVREQIEITDRLQAVEIKQ